MINNSYYSQDVHGPYELHDIGNLDLEEGGTIRDCKLAYATLGTLNTANDNAILIPTWYSGTNKIIEQVYIGKGRALDPDKYFIIVVNQIGGGLSSSPHNTPAPAVMGHFPHVRIGDDVRAQHKFITEKFDLKRFALVVGGSMGAQQTYEWAVRYPDMVKRAAPSPVPRETPSTISFSLKPSSRRSHPTPVSTRVSTHRRPMYEKVCCATPKCGQ
jgi:homoserine O-acetyltransferase